MQTQPGVGAVLCDDLMFTSRITGTARALGLEMRTCRTPAALEALAAAQPLVCVLLDVHHAELDVAALVPRLKADRACRVIAFGSHVAVDVLRAAQTAGCDVVLPRSQFVNQLATALPEWYSS